MAEQRCPAYYTATLVNDTHYPSLQEDIEADVVIVGGGFTGINTAIELAEKGHSVVVLEQHRIAWGASGRNGGQVTGSLSGDTAMQKHMAGSLGSEAEQFVWDLRWRGHDIIKQRIAKYNINCDLKFGHLHTAYKPVHMAELQASYDEALRYGMEKDVRLLTKADMADYLETDIYHGAIYNKRNMHLHPANLCLGEAAAARSLGVQIYEDTEVQYIKHDSLPTVVCRHGRVQAQKVLLAGNAYHKLERAQLRGKLFPASGGIVATEPLGELAEVINPRDVAVYDCRFVLDYYRLTADKRLLFGGGANYSGRASRNIENELRPSIEHTFPRLRGVKIEYQWSGLMGITVNRIPQLGRVSRNVFYAQGYSGHGIASSHIVGEIMAKALEGELREYDVFAQCPQVKIPGGDWLGNQMLAIGMWYYGLREKLR